MLHRLATTGYFTFNWEIGSFQGAWRRLFYGGVVTPHFVAHYKTLGKGEKTY
jgi:hypothetical protein